MVLSAIIPSLAAGLALLPSLVFGGEVWRLVTWPFAEGLGLWGVLNLFFLWYFGRELEATLGRVRMARLFVGIWLAFTVATMVVGLLLFTGLAGLGLVEFMILILWIAENPTRRFLFNIPAWAFGAVLLALQVLQLIAARSASGLLTLALGLFAVALVARRQGLLTAYAWIPGSTSAEPGSRPRRVPVAQQRETRRKASDEARMDDLLGKISEQGLHSLTKSERAELEKLRQRRKR